MMPGDGGGWALVCRGTSLLSWVCCLPFPKPALHLSGQRLPPGGHGDP